MSVAVQSPASPPTPAISESSSQRPMTISDLLSSMSQRQKAEFFLSLATEDPHSYLSVATGIVQAMQGGDNAEDRLNALWQGSSQDSKRSNMPGMPSAWKVKNKVVIGPKKKEWETSEQAAARADDKTSYGAFDSLESLVQSQQSNDNVNIMLGRHFRTVCNELAHREEDDISPLTYHDKWGKQQTFDPVTDDRRSLSALTPLIDQGREQGREMGKKMRDLPTPDYVITSALPRTKESAGYYLDCEVKDYEYGEETGTFVTKDGTEIPYESTGWLNENTYGAPLHTEVTHLSDIITKAVKKGYKNIFVSGHGNVSVCLDRWMQERGAQDSSQYFQNGEVHMHSLARSDILEGEAELSKALGTTSAVASDAISSPMAQGGKANRRPKVETESTVSTQATDSELASVVSKDNVSIKSGGGWMDSIRSRMPSFSTLPRPPMLTAAVAA